MCDHNHPTLDPETQKRLILAGLYYMGHRGPTTEAAVRDLHRQDFAALFAVLSPRALTLNDVRAHLAMHGWRGSPESLMADSFVDPQSGELYSWPAALQLQFTRQPVEPEAAIPFPLVEMVEHGRVAQAATLAAAFENSEQSDPDVFVKKEHRHELGAKVDAPDWGDPLVDTEPLLGEPTAGEPKV